MRTLHIRDLIPVDLNSILYKYETNLVEFFTDVSMAKNKDQNLILNIYIC